MAVFYILIYLIVNGNKIQGRRRYRVIDNSKINGSYTETKRKAEKREEWRMLVYSEGAKNYE